MIKPTHAGAAEPAAGGAGVAQAKALLAGAGLECPPIPAELMWRASRAYGRASTPGSVPWDVRSRV